MAEIFTKILSAEWRTFQPLSGYAFATVFILAVFSGIRSLYHRTSKDTQPSPNHKVVEEIIPLPHFKWYETEPLKLRPFKPKYHLTMAVENMPVSELIEMDKNYVSRLQLREQLMIEKPEDILAATEAVRPAVDEIYTWMLGTYLPSRFPLMFRVHTADQKSDVRKFQNLVTGKSGPVTPPASATEALRILGLNVDEDILILLPSEDGDGYTLQGFVNCSAAGFNTREKWLMKLRDIHKPVPGYKEKLEKSMDRYFEKLEIGKFVQRANWSIATTPDLYITGDHHLTEEDQIAEDAKEIDLTNVFVRCERQTLYRLPQTKAIVFSFKTYLYPIADIKAEGLGEDLSNAIDGLRLGSVPAMNHYKRGIIWGDSVKAFLRS